MPKVATILSEHGHGEKSVSLLLTRDALFLDPDGIPSPGIGLSPTQARALAGRLLTLASQADGEMPEPVLSAAILAVHDGTPCGDRASALAVMMARNSDATLYLHIRDQFAWHNDAHDIVEQCAWQLDAMRGIAARCASEAASQGVRMKPCVMSMDADGGGIAPPGVDIDFVILPQHDGSPAPAALPGNLGRYVVLVR